MLVKYFLHRMATAVKWLLICGFALANGPLWAVEGESYINFETIPTRALALSEDGNRLFVANTPDSRLEIFAIAANGNLTPAGSVTVGLDPIALAVNNGQVWVVNHLSDSISIVDVTTPQPKVIQTLLVGDEPRDIVFAGSSNNRRAFITAARRGQNHPANPENETLIPGIGRADVWVFDADNPGTALGGEPITIVQLFADKPGALAATPDGSQVYVSIFTSGNQTTTIRDRAVCASGFGGNNSSENNGPCRLPNGLTNPGGVPAPNSSQADNSASPLTGLIVTFDEASGEWRDAAGRDFSNSVGFSLPDNDVFVIDATAATPREIDAFQHVGTLNFNISIHPTNGKAYVSTIDAINSNRFISLPGAGAFPNPERIRGAAQTADPATGHTLNGHLYESQVAILDRSNSGANRVVSRHLNKHIDYEVVPSPPGVKAHSVANPQGSVFSADGTTLFIAALGSNKIVPFTTSQLDNDSFVPDGSTHITLSGDGGPTDMVIRGNFMFAYRRFDNAISTIDLSEQREIASTQMFSPEPTNVTRGRKFLYDALLTSSNGEANCNVCHPSADKDDLAWNLGAPFAPETPNNNDFVIGGEASFSPLKGPMTVLTLRGIKDTGPMFWRGDATSANQNNERANFQNFNVVFPALLGREDMLSPTDFAAFTDWVLTLVPPPNPHRGLDNSLNTRQATGENIFMGGEGRTDSFLICESCHTLNRAQGFFGSDGRSSIEGEPQTFKVTQLRTTYDKVGMFGQNRGLVTPGSLGPQIRGTGTLHDGAAAGVESFLSDEPFSTDARQEARLADFVYAFPSNLAPIVGQQTTLAANSGIDVRNRVALFQNRCRTPFVLATIGNSTECDLVAKGMLNGREKGYLMLANGSFRDDTGATLSSTALMSLAAVAGQELTFTAVYPGGGTRLGIDRNENGILDGIEAGDTGGDNGGDNNGDNGDGGDDSNGDDGGVIIPDPIANAGIDQRVRESSFFVSITVSLDGSASTDAVSFSWRQISGREVTLINADSAMAEFSAPTFVSRGAPIELVFELQVTNSDGVTDTDTVTVTVVDRRDL